MTHYPSCFKSILVKRHDCLALSITPFFLSVKLNIHSQSAMSVLCVKCVSEKASLECSQCGQGQCELGKLYITSLSLSFSLSLSQSSLSLCSDNSEWLASVRICEEMIHEVQAYRQLLKEQVKKALDDFKQLLDTRQAVSIHTVPVYTSKKYYMCGKVRLSRVII